MITKGLLQGADMSSATSSLELEDYPVQNLKVLQYWLRVKMVVKLWLPFFRYISETCKLYIYNICMFMFKSVFVYLCFNVIYIHNIMHCHTYLKNMSFPGFAAFPEPAHGPPTLLWANLLW